MGHGGTRERISEQIGREKIEEEDDLSTVRYRIGKKNGVGRG